MFTKKRKILFCSEASFANTGFGSIYRELISRVHASGKFRVAEFATGSMVNDERIGQIKWRFYANNVSDEDPRSAVYHSATENNFGAWRFNKVLLDFEPDIVVDIRDPVHFQHESMSPLRQYFHWFIMPTVDSMPQPSEWLSIFMGANTVTTYTEYANKALKDTGIDIKLIDTLGPGINTEIFRPLNKGAARAKYGIDQGAKILGFISRNQIRKLYPALFKNFAQVLKNEPNTEKCYLHCHTAFPDLKPWNIPRLLLDYDIASNVLFTYYCNNCKNTFISTWKGSATHCDNCGELKAIHPTTLRGPKQEQMAEIYNIYDAYIQFVNCEGMGMGLIEAAACGIPIAAPNYSAMQSILENVGGDPIDYTLAREITTDAERAVPDNNSTINLITKLVKTPREILALKGRKQYEKCVERYDWDVVAARWIEALEKVELMGNQGRWNMPLRQDVCLTLNSENSVIDKLNSKLMSAGVITRNNNSILHEFYNKFLLDKAGLPTFGWTDEQIETALEGFERDKIDFMKALSGQEIVETEDFIRFADMVEAANL